MTKQILAFLFCFIRELNLYSPLTYSLTSAHELKPYTPPLPSPSPPRANSNLYSPLTLTLRPPICQKHFKICLFRTKRRTKSQP